MFNMVKYKTLFLSTVFSVFAYTSCDKANELSLPPIENYWTIEEEIFRVSPGKGTVWVENLSAITSTSTTETYLFIQFKNKPVPGNYTVKAYNANSAASLGNRECAITCTGVTPDNTFSSTGKTDEMVEVTLVDDKLKFFFAGVEMRNTSKTTFLTAILNEK